MRPPAPAPAHAPAADSLAAEAHLREQCARRLAGFEAQALQAPAVAGLRPAAVALVVVEAGHGAGVAGMPTWEAWSTAAALLLTRRPGGMRRHAGQWALPGGRVDAGESPEQTALRELAEEVGLVLGPEAVLGRLDDYATRSGYLITPVVAWGGTAHALQPNPAEVEAIHRIPLQEFLRPDAPWLDASDHGPHPVLRMPVGETWIAAPTAALIYQFCEVALRGRPTRVAHFDQPAFAWT